MEEKRNYVVYYCNIYGEDIERVIFTTPEKAKTIRWFIDTFHLDGAVELAENYEGEEI